MSIEAIRARADAYKDQGTPGLNAPKDRADLLEALDAALEENAKQRAALDAVLAECQAEEDDIDAAGWSNQNLAMTSTYRIRQLITEALA